MRGRGVGRIVNIITKTLWLRLIMCPVIGSHTTDPHTPTKLTRICMSLTPRSSFSSRVILHIDLGREGGREREAACLEQMERYCINRYRDTD